MLALKFITAIFCSFGAYAGVGGYFTMLKLIVVVLPFLTARLNITCSTPKGIEDVSAYPYLFAELMGHGWAAEELTKLAGGNLLRVFSEVSWPPTALSIWVVLWFAYDSLGHAINFSKL